MRAALFTIEEGTAEVEEIITQNATGERTKLGQGSNMKGRPPRKRKGGYLDRLRPVMETFLGHLELASMTWMEEVPGELNDEERGDTTSPDIVRLAVNKHDLFAKVMLGDVHTWEQTKLFFMKH
jgi:hypothetical protein